MYFQDIGHVDLLSGGNKEEGRLVLRRDEALLSFPVGIPGLDHIVIHPESFRTLEREIQQHFNFDWLSLMEKISDELRSHGYKVELVNDQAIDTAPASNNWAGYLKDIVLQFMVGASVLGTALFLKWYFS